MCNKIVTFVKLKSKPQSLRQHPDNNETTPRNQRNNTPKTKETAPPIGKRISKEHIKQINKRKMKTVMISR